MSAALSFALTLVDEVVPLVLSGVMGAAEALAQGRRAVAAMAEDDRDPTPEEWDRLNAGLASLRERLHND